MTCLRFDATFRGDDALAVLGRCTPATLRFPWSKASPSLVWTSLHISVWPDPLPPFIDLTATAPGLCSATPLVASSSPNSGAQVRSRSGYNVFTRTNLRIS
jgi:hypothetical protein